MCDFVRGFVCVVCVLCVHMLMCAYAHRCVCVVLCCVCTQHRPGPLGSTELSFFVFLFLHNGIFLFKINLY